MSSISDKMEDQEPEVSGKDDVGTTNVNIQDGVPAPAPEGPPLVFLREESLFGTRTPHYSEYLKHEEMYKSIARSINKTHITGLQRLNGLWRIYLDNLTDKATLIAQGVNIRGRTLPVLQTNPFRPDYENTTRIRVQNIPLSADDGMLTRAFILKGLDVISNNREKLRIDGKLTNCDTGDRIVTVKTSSLKEPLNRFMYIGKYNVKHRQMLLANHSQRSPILQQVGTAMDAETYKAHVDHLNNAGYTALLMSLGHELGLFDRMIHEDQPLTSSQLAAKAGMKERYVREWLHGMVAGQVVSYNKETGEFYIAQHNHASLRAAASWAGGIGVWAARKDDLKQCFLQESPYAFDAKDEVTFRRWYGGFRATIGNDFIQKLICPKLSENGIAAKIEAGVNVLEACCGSGEFSVELAGRFPKSTFTCLDISREAITIAKERAQSAQIPNATFVVEDILNLPDAMTDKYDVVMLFDALHDLPDPHKALSQIHKVLKPGGRFVLFEFRPGSRLEDEVGNLEASMLYTCSVFYCLPIGLSAEPRTAFGPCWGRDNVITALREQFSVDELVNLSSMSDLHFCTKK